jgi:AmiR/NasT family two-component response regulator
MSRSSPFSVRGRRALAIVRDERDLSVLTRQLDRLGMTAVDCDPHDAIPPLDSFDVIIVDSDTIPVRLDLCPAVAFRIPVIALVGTETPSRLKGVLDLEPSCFLVKPLRSAGLYSALVLAFDQARRREDASRRVERLEEQVRARRVVLAALLQVMRVRDLSEPEAFAWIRRCAMEQRMTIEGLSARIVASDGRFPKSSRIA